MKRTLLFIAFILFTSNANACECAKRLTVMERFDAAEYVAIMEAQMPEVYEYQGWTHRKYKLVTLETFKGEPLPEYEIVQSEPRSSCSRDVTSKTKYLAFIAKDGKLSLRYCSDTQSIEYFEKLYPNWRSDLNEKISNENS